MLTMLHAAHILPNPVTRVPRIVLVAMVIGLAALAGGGGIHMTSDVIQEAFGHALKELVLSPERNLGDSSARELSGARDIVTVEIDGKPYAFVAAYNDDGVQALNLTIPTGLPVRQGDRTDGGSLELNGAHSITAWKDDNDHVFVAVAARDDDGVQVFNVTTLPSGGDDLDATDSVTDGGSAELEGASGIDAYEYGGKRYVVVSAHDDNGVQVVDVTDPDNIVLKDSFSDTGTTILNGAMDVKAYKVGGHVYAAVTAHGDNGIQIMNITDPDDIKPMDDLQGRQDLLLSSANNLDIFTNSGSTYAVVTSQTNNDQHGIQVLDITDPTSIVIAGQLANQYFERLDQPRDLSIFDYAGSKFAAVASHNADALAIIDLTDPYAPAEGGYLNDTSTTRLGDVNSVAPFWVDGSLYLITASGGSSANRGVQVLSTSTTTNTNDPPEVHVTHDRVVYEGAMIYLDAQVSDSDNDRLTYIWFLTGGAVTDPFAKETYFIAPSVSSDTTYTATLTATDPHGASASDEVVIRVLDDGDAGINPVMVGSLEDDNPHALGDTNFVKVFQNNDVHYAAVTAYSDDKFATISLADPANPTLVNSTTGFFGANGLDLFEASDGRPFAVVTGLDTGAVSVVDLADPIGFQVGIQHENATESIATFRQGGTNYAVTGSHSNYMLHVFSLLDPALPSAVTNGHVDIFPTTPSVFHVFDNSAGQYAALTSSAGCTVSFYDLADVSNITHTSTIGDEPSDCRFTGVRGIDTFSHGGDTYAVVAAQSAASLHVIDLSNITNPTVSGSYTDYGVVADIHYVDTFEWSGKTWAAASVFAAGGEFGGGDVLVFDVSDPDRPVFAGNITTGTKPTVGFSGLETFYHDGNMYAAMGSNYNGGVHVVKFTDNSPPTVQTAPDQIVAEASQVRLDGTIRDSDGDTLTHEWSYAKPSPSDPEFLLLPGNSWTQLRIDVRAPTVAANTTYTFTLTATDEHGAPATDDMTVLVYNIPSQPPIVDAGDDQRVDEGTLVTLTGSATDPEQETMTYEWVCRNDSDTILDHGPSSSPSVTFIAPEVSFGSVTYTCTFTATDPHGSSGHDTIAITVRDVPVDRPVLDMIGEFRPIVVQYTTWVDPGAVCVTLYDGTPLTVTTTGSVDTSTIGSYDITYWCEHNGRSFSHTRTVTVIPAASDQHPTINIIHDRGAIASGLTNPDFGDDAVCTDREDGDISHTITASVSYNGRNTRATITYTCTDSGGHTVTDTNTVGVIPDADNDDGTASPNSPPQIDVIGGTIHVNVGDSYTDPGATCTDVEDGTWTITASNTVDTSTAGHYYLVYICTDDDGATQTNGGARSVFVIAPAADTPPTLTISDTSDIVIPVNGTWSLPSATCTDKENGDLTDRIEKRGVNSVNVHKPGTYHITYFCTDGANNQVQDGIRVIVEAPP